jgi:hypothetical protein
MKRETFEIPDPLQPYGSNPVTIESCNVRERHALSDESARYAAAYNAVRSEHDEKVQAIKDHFNAQRKEVIDCNFAKRDAA